MHINAANALHGNFQFPMRTAKLHVSWALL